MPPPERPGIQRQRSRVHFEDDLPSPAQQPAGVDTNDPSNPFRDGQASSQWRSDMGSVPNPPPAYTQGADRRGSDESQETLYDPGHGQPPENGDKFDFSSYRHPYDIDPPADAHGRGGPPRDARRRRSSSTAYEKQPRSYDLDSGRNRQSQDDMPTGCDGYPNPTAHRGLTANLLDLRDAERGGGRDWDQDTDRSTSRAGSTGGWGMNRLDSNVSIGSGPLDPDDPKVTGATRMLLDDPDDLEKNCQKQMDLRYMSYKQRRKEAQKIKIQFNVTSVLNRQKFIITLAKSLMTYGAPSHRIESQLVAASRILEIDAEFIHLPNIVLVSFGDPEMKTSETHYVKCGGRLALGNLHKVHTIYRQVVHDEISAKKAMNILIELLNAPPIYSTIPRCFLGFWLSALICTLAFGGSFLDMWIAGFGSFVLCALQLTLVTKSALYANVFEITIAIFISFLARGLSSIKSQIFCYTAISSAGIVGILPGYLILSSSLELASKNILTGSVKMVYALIYTLFLGFGLQIGSDLYLLFDHGSRHRLDALAEAMTRSIVYTGAFVSDNSTRFGPDGPLFGTFTFMNGSTLTQEHIVNGCYRPPEFPWYLQPFPWWAQFFIVPLFSILSSLANLQPWRSKQLIVMVVISCFAYAANKVANHYIFNRSDVVSAIGAFAVGVLGNAYSRKMGGTAFTSMVTGVLFLVPSGLSQAGGISASGNGIDIGGAMIAVTIGITVGLFMSQALVYMFGTRKNAAMFSF
ncbi:hypothetical protein EWM64_g6553 [Hericium alpestre]|uniref:Threonine/serine exporter-like N-terminal domain-containing protein n=1 Tax=Hericium alpestre TaxID=135208 RepID=A0A4Y9ZTB8_9AGAM|nr:hypothetical protein EWM64_g6553 [Hericium alpestre]